MQVCVYVYMCICMCIHLCVNGTSGKLTSGFKCNVTFYSLLTGDLFSGLVSLQGFVYVCFYKIHSLLTGDLLSDLVSLQGFLFVCFIKFILCLLATYFLVL